MRNLPWTTMGHETAATRPRRKTAVIVDDGVAVALVLLEASQPATVGSQFVHGGRTWVVTGVRRGSRVPVAEPVQPGPTAADAARLN